MAEPTLQDMMRQSAEKQEIELGEKIIETQIKILTVSYDKGMAYVNVVVIAGYAAFFGLWTLTKPYLAKDAAIWAALLMLISAGTFVFFQVYQMVFIAQSLHSQHLNLEQKLRGQPAHIILTELKRLEESGKRSALLLLSVWRIQLLIAVITALLAFVILGYAYVRALLSGPV
jgi:hypothetical protein